MVLDTRLAPVDTGLASSYDFRVAHISIKRDDQEVCGDTAIVVEKDLDTRWVGVFDGLGHGPLAAEASLRAVEFLKDMPANTSVLRACEGLDLALTRTRGAVGLLLKVQGLEIEGANVGNIEMRLRGCDVPALPTPGIFGKRIRRLRIFRGLLAPGTRLFAFSDGLPRDLPLDDASSMSPALACRHLLEEHRDPRDDATLLIADFNTGLP